MCALHVTHTRKLTDKTQARLIADEWQHETDCTVSQDETINLVHSKTQARLSIMKIATSM